MLGRTLAALDASSCVVHPQQFSVRAEKTSPPMASFVALGDRAFVDENYEQAVELYTKVRATDRRCITQQPVAAACTPRRVLAGVLASHP